MAVIKSKPGLEAHIVGDGKELRGERTSHAAGLTITHITAPVGKEFSILTRVQSPYEIKHDGITFKIKINGTPVLASIIKKKSYEDNKMTAERTVSGVCEGSTRGTMLQPFKFVEMSEGAPNPEIIIQVFEVHIQGPADCVPVQDLLTIDGELAHGEAKLVGPKVVWEAKNATKEPVATFIFRYGRLNDTPRKKALLKKTFIESIPLYYPDSANAATEPNTPMSSSKKREHDFEQDTPSKRPKQKANNKNYQPTVEDDDGEEDEANDTPVRTPQFKKTPTPRRTPSKPKQTSKYQATVEDDTSEEDEANDLPIRTPQFKKTSTSTPRRTPSKPGKHQATVEDCNDSDGDSPGTLPASTPPPRRSTNATPARKSTEGTKATPKKSQPNPKQTPATSTPTKLQGFKLKPAGTPKTKGLTDLMPIDLTEDD